jgi:predicted Zn-dependent protease
MNGNACAGVGRGPSPRRRPRPAALLLCPLLASCLLAAHTPCAADLWTEFEKTIGEMVLAEMSLRHGRVADPSLQQWVDRIGKPVAAQSTRHLPFRFVLMDTFEDNAFSLPGGTVCVTRGLLNHVTSDEELGGVLAHEVAHAENRDFQRHLQEQLVIVGLQSILRDHLSDEWIMATQVVQVLEVLWRSRKHELQADVEGTNIAYAARFDPQGLISFLQGIGTGSQLGGELFATHPRPAKRLQAVRERIRELESNDYDGLLAIGDSLRDRLHYARAQRLYEQAAKMSPGRPEAEARLDDLRARRGLPAGADAATLALPDDQRQQVQQSLAAFRDAAKPLQESQKKLAGELRRFYADRQIAQALEVAQVIAPETHDPAYLLTLAHAYYAMGLAWKEAMRQSEILSRGGAIRAGWERSGADLLATHKVAGLTGANEAELLAAAEQFAGAAPALTATTEVLARSARVSRELSTATRLLAAALLALVGTGPGAPLGRINYTRFLILQGDVALSESRLQRVAKTGQQVHAEIVRRHLEALTLQMSLLHATARPELRAQDWQLIATRLPLPPSSASGDGPRLLGEELLDQHLPPDAGPAALQALDSVLRMCYLDLRAEREN